MNTKTNSKVGWGIRYLYEYNLKNILLQLNIFDAISWVGSWSGEGGTGLKDIMRIKDQI